MSKEKATEKEMSHYSKEQHCPECGCHYYVNKNQCGDGHRTCFNCHQEWWTDIDYDNRKLEILCAVRDIEFSKERLIDELEGFRQGFRDAVNFAPGTAEEKKVFVFSMEAYHHQVDVMIVALGGESVREKQ